MHKHTYIHKNKHIKTYEHISEHTYIHTYACTLTYTYKYILTVSLSVSVCLSLSACIKLKIFILIFQPQRGLVSKYPADLTLLWPHSGSLHHRLLCSSNGNELLVPQTRTAMAHPQFFVSIAD